MKSLLIAFLNGLITCIENGDDRAFAKLIRIASMQIANLPNIPSDKRWAVSKISISLEEIAYAIETSLNGEG